jgi:Mg-chelatase subunit ChlI
VTCTSLAGVGDVAVLFQCDVEVDDVPALQDLGGGRHAVADHVVARGVQRVGIAILALAGRARLEPLDDEGVDQVVHRHRRHADQVQAVQVGEHFGQQLARRRHQGDFFRSLGHG